MRYHFEKPFNYKQVFGKTYICNHPVYNRCTLYTYGPIGLAVIQQRYDEKTKCTYWTELDEWLPNPIYANPKFKEYLLERGREPENGLYPTVTVRQIMWALKMKPIKRERWETCFDRREI